jgi:hypothetical protein
LTQVGFDKLGSTSTSGEIIITFYEFAQLDNGEPYTPSSSNTHFPAPFHVFLTTLSLWGTNSPRRKETRSHTC